MSARTPLEDQIRVALISKVKSGVAQEALDATQAELARIASAHKDATSRALDPRATREAAASAEGEMKALAFEEARLETAVKQLTSRVRVLQEGERRASLEAERDKVRQDRDQLVEDLKEVPALIEKLAGLANRIAENDARIRSTGGSLESAESVSRRCPPSWDWPYDKGGGPVRRLGQSPLPNWFSSGPAWGHRW